MSTEAVTWAMDDAPMLLTDKGKPDTTARNVLQVLGEHAHKDGGGAHPSVLRIQYRTGFDRRTVQRALKRLEAGGLITASGQVNGRTVWRLSLHLKRPASDWSDLERGEEEERRAAAERQRRSRAKRVTDSASVTVTHSDDVTQADVTHSNDVSHALKVRDVTHSASARHALNAALTTNQPSEQPPATPVAEVGGDSYPSQEQALLAPIDTDGFALTDSMRRWALQTFGPHLNVDYETDQFLDHFRANGARRNNWAAEWQKWIRRSAKFASERATRPPLRAVPGGRANQTATLLADALARRAARQESR
ncbi:MULTISPECIES: helix-turn-helix domain-containing protein [Streptomyces]|nr:MULTISPECIES: helix-turn-helix domain-containing protein [Streptomyces]UUS30860.1 helix-turn-helix domain-containing protein [Streptomyces changanensis]